MQNWLQLALNGWIVITTEFNLETAWVRPLKEDQRWVGIRPQFFQKFIARIKTELIRLAIDER